MSIYNEIAQWFIIASIYIAVWVETGRDFRR